MARTGYNLMQKLTHHNSLLSDKCVAWVPTDTQALYEKNLNDPEQQKLLQQYGWIGVDISYTHNSHAFRTAEFETKENFIAVGCSHTYGIGLHQHQTWSELLSGMLDLSVYNLGVPGGSADTCYRVVKHYVKELRPKFVAMLQPEPSRQEIFIRGLPYIYVPNGADEENLSSSPWLKHWYANDDNGNVAAQKNIDAIIGICKTYQVDFYMVEAHHVSGHGPHNFRTSTGLSLARDLQHPGTAFHHRLATEFLKNITNKHTHG